jgi:GNAT superfamily N-acetyltransferase
VLGEDMIFVSSFGKAHTRADVAAALQSGAMKIERMESYDISTRIYGDTGREMGVLIYKADTKMTNGGDVTEGITCSTSIYEMRGGNWFMISQHQSPFEGSSIMVELRNATAADEARCVELLGELKSATKSGPIRPFGETFQMLLSKQRGEITLAQEDTETTGILGMATVSYNLALRYGGEYCQLEELVVTPAARGKNIGGLLVQRIVDNARARGCAEIGLYLLETTEHNRPFYEKYGFEVIGTEMRQTLV